MRAIQRRQAVAKAIPRKRWRASKRNAVMRLALTKRPTTADVRAQDRGCPICGEDGSHLHLEERAAHKSQPTALDMLGFSAQRWIRGSLEIVCHSCGTSYSNSVVRDWNAAKYSRRFADFGKVKFPLPFEKRKKSLRQTLIDQLVPAKRKLVNLKKGNTIWKKPKRMRRMENWARSCQGLPLLQDD